MPSFDTPNITAEYTPPSVPQGTVTLTMPLDVAARLHALVGACNGGRETCIEGGYNSASSLYSALGAAVPYDQQLILARTEVGSSPTIDLHKSYTFVPRTWK